MELQPFLVRLLVGVLVVWLMEKLMGVIPANTQLKEILNVILIVVVVLYVLFGGTFLH